MYAPIPSDKMLPARLVLHRYGIVDRTLSRWLTSEKLKFPRPLIINRCRYFSESELIAWERSNVSNRTSEMA